MQRMLVGVRPVVDDAWRIVVFTVNDARRALPYVARVVRDAADAFRNAQQIRQALMHNISSRERMLLSEQRDAALHRLNSAIDECNTAGADLLDIPEGVVRFHAVLNERHISLIWRLGEPTENAWPGLGDHPSVERKPHAAAR